MIEVASWFTSGGGAVPRQEATKAVSRPYSAAAAAAIYGEGGGALRLMTVCRIKNKFSMSREDLVRAIACPFNLQDSSHSTT
jgi:hypothetical protein